MSAVAAFRRRDVNASDAIAEVLHPNMGYREKLRRRGVEPKDFDRANRLQLKRQQAEQRARKQAEAAAKPEIFKLAKFKSVQPRVFQEKTHNSEDAERPIRHEFLRRGASATASQKRIVPKRDTTERTITLALDTSGPMAGSAVGLECGQKPKRSHVKPPIPSRQELEELNAKLARLNHKDKPDFVTSNAWEVIRATPAQASFDEKTKPKYDSFGRIPEYLLQRKEELAREEEERRRNMPDPDCPPGMMTLDEDERLRTLNTLQQSLDEAQRQVARLPLRIESLSQIRRKDELLARIQEIEDAIRVFSKAKVFVAKPSSSVVPDNGTGNPRLGRRRFRRQSSSQENASAA